MTIKSGPIKLFLECAGRINGDLLTVRGQGEGIVEKGKFSLALEFSQIPKGFSVSAAALWTCCSTPSFAIEENGAVNLLTLSRGKYRCERRFDFGPYGAYDYNYELRLSETESVMRATGLIEGNLSLPEMDYVDDSFSEIMIPTAPNEMVSYVRARFRSREGEDIPVKMVGRYSPLSEDNQWGCSAQVIERQRYQMRTSYINDLDADGSKLSLNYLTVVSGISTPMVAMEKVKQLAASA